ncbi:hypothetical protein GLW00_11895 [Halobacillus litoralis]|uniref:Small peptidoglycan-associated lipoprotein n=1 Tax=Halobacillus litoralis TaxID=45668 RepID=A0A845FAX5_9BACI|nr:hypothetical protein [Halobacillus litoralis]MYL71562.1 hypothetical protein [Halobacillus litoralis]
MKKQAWTMIIILSLFLVGCSSENEEISKELLPEVEGTYTMLQIFGDDDNNISTPDFLSHYDDEQLNKTFPSWIGIAKTEARNRYSSLDIEETPQYYFFDTKGLVLKTGNNEEARNFIEDKLNNNE